MAETLPKDPATLAALHPAWTREVQYRDHKHSLQLYGSQYMALKRPSRLPEAGREYAAGDPVNLIDWKAYGRLGQLIVREVRDQSTSRVLIAIDATATMQWPTNEVPQPVAATKAEVALRLGLHLAYVHLRMGDQVEVWLLTQDQASHPELVFKPRRASEIIALYEQLVGSGFAMGRLGQEFHAAAFPTAKRDRVIWLGDALGGARTFDILAMGKRSFFVHVLSSLELSTDWLTADTSYFDQETGHALREYQGPVLKQPGNYQAQIAAWCEGLKNRQLQCGGDYLRVTEATAISIYLAAFNDFVQGSGTGSERGATRR